MEISEKLVKPVMETKYLTVDNADRYRSIARFFYFKYEKLKYWIYQEEVFEELKQAAYFSEYTIEQCQQDLNALVTWGNLTTMQDTKKVTSIEEFKNKKFRYQLSEYGVEIERMVIRLENLFIEGSSLEPTLLERIRLNLSKIESIEKEDRDHIYSWWGDLNHDFIRLNQNYQDYMRELNSVKAEEMMKTKEFLLFKDKLVDYLRSFVKSLQSNVVIIEQYLKSANPEIVQKILNQVTAYELSIPRIEVEVDEKQISEKMAGRWESIQEWFVGKNGIDTEAGKVFETTNEIIRKITRYATRISELGNNGANRREEYYKIAVMFGKCRDIKEAHCLSANVFGVERPIHLKGDLKRETESINSGVYEEEPLQVVVTLRVRNYKEKAKRTGIVDRTAEKEAMREETLKRLKQEEELLQSYISGNRLDFATLPVLEPQVRDVFLAWLSKALENKEYKAKTQEGRIYHIEKGETGESCTLSCTDGTFRMPAYVLVFEEE
ncbi:MAG: TIGR02677 family protein [Lachnospiraceae bacterium]